MRRRSITFRISFPKFIDKEEYEPPRFSSRIRRIELVAAGAPEPANTNRGGRLHGPGHPHAGASYRFCEGCGSSAVRPERSGANAAELGGLHAWRIAA